MALNHHQFRMFIPAHELMGFVPGDDDSEFEYSQAYGLLAEKRRHNTQALKGESLIKSVAREGVKQPVQIVEKYDGHPDSKVGIILDGHHRVAAAYDIDPNMEVPVKNDY
ncbi:hypothetical protein UFOVP361_145 [uncultured Caudovirales phage]|uniref:ParB/Sulfiredoxin n=1 Tax=uncultured Caudovirales phage TaxID=2100421 RepID=A0A6J7WZK9_9CAUD|nr:hypothetical protein UFOVP361_145 [uncultured Caudovirales phage]